MSNSHYLNNQTQEATIAIKYLRMALKEISDLKCKMSNYETDIKNSIRALEDDITNFYNYKKS